MNHLDLLHKHLDAKTPHQEKAGDWLRHGSLAHHTAGFHGSHLAGTFRTLGESAIALPSDGIVMLKLQP